jgi:alcohol dehydrogenase/L-iditol 2-dehydrogenase
VAYNVVIAKAGVKAGDCVAVLGPGPIGILCVHMAKTAGAGHIVVFGAPGDEKRLEIAQEYGATETYVLDGTTDPKTAAAKFNEGYGFDKVIDAAGPAATLKISMDIVMPGGIINKVAWGPKPVDMSLDPLLSKGVTLQGSFSHTWDIWEKVLVMMGKGQMPLDALITHELPLEQWHEGFELIESRKGLKVVLKP